MSGFYLQGVFLRSTDFTQIWLSNKSMSENTNTSQTLWFHHQDYASRILDIHAQTNQWNLNAHNLHFENILACQSGSQSCQRFNEHLDLAHSGNQWSPSEETEMFRLHDTLGNRWAVISQRLATGRSDNAVKNHFYSRLRRSLRRLNKAISEKYKKSGREIKPQVIYKIVEAAEESFKTQPMCSSQLSILAKQLKNNMLTLPEETGEQVQEAHLQALIDGIWKFNQDYKRKPKKMRKSGSFYTQNQDFNPKQLTQASSQPLTEIQIPSMRSLFIAQAQLSGKNQINWKPWVKSHTQKRISPIIVTSSRPQPRPNNQTVQSIFNLQDKTSSRSSRKELCEGELKLLQQSQAEGKGESIISFIQQIQLISFN